MFSKSSGKSNLTIGLLPHSIIKRKQKQTSKSRQFPAKTFFSQQIKFTRKLQKIIKKVGESLVSKTKT